MCVCVCVYTGADIWDGVITETASKDWRGGGWPHARRLFQAEGTANAKVLCLRTGRAVGIRTSIPESRSEHHRRLWGVVVMLRLRPQGFGRTWVLLWGGKTRFQQSPAWWMVYSGYCVKTGLKGRNRRVSWEAVAITQARDSGGWVWAGDTGGDEK